MEDLMDNRQKLEKYGLYDPRFEHDSCGVGFVCDIRGRKSHAIIQQGLEVLRRLSHRGATGADPKTGDGAGLLIQMPHEFFSEACARLDIALPGEGEYGSGLIFLPTIEKERRFCKGVLGRVVKEEGQALLGWRQVPVDNSGIGKSACQSQPAIEQVFIAKGKGIKDQLAFERKLYVIRKQLEKVIRASELKQKSFFYITNLSSRTFSYKGLLMPQQLEGFFLDLKKETLKSALSLVHSRYSTNTFPAWDLAQPFRFLAHNGEINTLRGNINWMRAREGLLKSKAFGKDLKKTLPVIVPKGSDSASLDNLFELLVLAGRPLASAMMMLIPAACQDDFYRFHACLMEPWDGPAAVAFTDGSSIGAVLDRNGLRPCRYLVTKRETVVMASEVGVLDIPPEEILISARLEPGKMLFIDTQAGRIISDAEIKAEIFSAQPYGKWLKDNMSSLDDLPARKPMTHDPRPTTQADFLTQLKAFNYTREDLKLILKPMAEKGSEPIGSMGDDTPHAALSARPQLLYNYFRQLFAQVTNPAIDPIREELVMSLETYLGPEGNLLVQTSRQAHKLRVKKPVLSDEELEKIRQIRMNGFRAKTISILFRAGDGKDLRKNLDRLCSRVALAIKQGYTFVILSDRSMDKNYCPLPALLAVGAAHHYLVQKSLRTRVGIILESGEPREVHHFALLFAYGADCVNPYLAYAAVEHLVREKELPPDAALALKNYLQAVDKGILKILSKMGISTLQSYRGAQIFEALGLNDEVIAKCFCGTASRINGAGFEIIAQEAISRHWQAYREDAALVPYLGNDGVYQWKKDGEFHLWNPDTISALQDAVRENNPQRYKEFSRLVNDQSKNPVTLRGLLKFKKTAPIPIEEVEPVERIVKRFATGAMSFGSISKDAHEAIAIAMNRLGGRSNTGEGGEDPVRFLPLPNGDSLRSAIKQVASGRFGVTTNYLAHADELQIKICQGAKPGEGGQLPGHKVSATIARIRYTTPGVTLISPPPHHDIYSIEDLAQLIFDLKNTNPQARISVKLVSEIGVGTVAAGVAKGHADMILISGGDGGTGASPLSSIKHAGLPWELGLAETHQTLVLNDLRSRVRLQADGQLRTGRDVAIAALLGAEEFAFATPVLICLGCVMLRHCHLNNCSLGIATQDESLCKRFRGQPEDIINYFRFVAQELREIMSSLGIRSVDEMVGRSELLEPNAEILPAKAKGIDFSKILYKLKTPKTVGRRCLMKQDHGIGQVLDLKLIALAKAALEKKEPVCLSLPIKNTNRATGAMLSGKVCEIYGENGLGEDTVHCKFKGIAGQSFAAWLARGVTFELEGLANDYVGKGISGGKVIIYPDQGAGYAAEENIIIGNTAFYGAICGEAYISGRAGERFCIRNSGLAAVVEGVGDHGCEYMTGGRVVVIGPTGRNFAAGMSGGIAYVYDPGQKFSDKCNKEMVDLEGLTTEDKTAIHELLQRHLHYTRSRQAKKILDAFEEESSCFVKVMPKEYKRILEMKEAEEGLELSEVLDG
ncbi:MAG: glutamate synthase large subunit [Candidatus Omnitrophota bacterium]|nr:glutamate synthase large subunit [Candidatus Omnitrophota bacterium]